MLVIQVMFLCIAFRWKYARNTEWTLYYTSRFKIFQRIAQFNMYVIVA